VLILGYHFAERVAETTGPGSELNTFLKWEQLAAYARADINRETGFRGTERVGRNLKEDAATLSVASRHQILSNQKLYGLWGLYTVPGRSSGLIEPGSVRLTASAQELVEGYYLPKLEEAGGSGRKAIAQMLTRETTRLDVKGSQRRLLSAVAGVLTQEFTSQERVFYEEHLVFGGLEDRTEGRQRQLVTLFQPMLKEQLFRWTPAAVRALAREGERRGEPWHALAGRLRRIAAAESVLAPASALFVYLQGCHDTETAELAKRLRRAWGSSIGTVAVDEIPALRAEMGGGDKAIGERWLAIAQAMSEGDYAGLIQLLLAQNRVVMQLRGGATAWIEEQNGRLHVRMSDERGELPEKRELPQLWRFPYFLDSLFAVARDLREGQHG
jgi:hypothetical protein